MSVAIRPLAKYMVGLSISDGEESAMRGFPLEEVNRTMLRFVAALLGQGAGVSFGHDWRDDGVMEAVHAYVQRFRLSVGGSSAPLLWNVIPWPDKASLSEVELQRLEGTLRVEEAGLPTTLPYESKVTERDRGNFAYLYLRARGLTHLRHKLVNGSNARVCLGGRLLRYAGRYPGVVEEAILTLRSQQPLYVTALLGGAAEQVILALTGQNSPSSLCPDTQKVELYGNPPFKDTGAGAGEDAKCDPEAVWHDFFQAGVQSLSATNRLTISENERLFNTQVVDEAIELILTGLGRVNRT